MQLSNKEQELLSTYKTGIRKNKLNDKCNVNFIEENSILIFQTGYLEEMISETIGLKINNEKGKFYIKTLDQKFNKYFSLEEILKIEKDFVLETFKEKANL